MPRWKDRAYKFRHVLLTLAILATLAAIAISLSPLFRMERSIAVILEPFFTIENLFIFKYFKLSDVAQLIIHVCLIWAFIFFAMWWFLAPRRNWLKIMSTPATPMKRAICIASLLSTMLSLGIFWLIIELCDAEPDASTITFSVVSYGSFLLIWGIWAFIFYKYWRQGDRYTQLGKMTRGLFAGSIAESIVSVIVFATNPHNNDCYCFRGSYFSLIISLTVIFWCFGPGLVFLYMRERRRQLLLEQHPHCSNCGYDLHGTTSPTCPECGHPI